MKRLLFIIVVVCLAFMLVGGAVYSLDHRGSINDLPNDVLYAQAISVNGVGPVLAGRIVTYRNTHKPIKIDDLDNVPGIGDKRLSLLKKKFK